MSSVTAEEWQNPQWMAPYDLDLRQELVTEVVRTVATAPEPAYRFEVWNEPDLAGLLFWHDTPVLLANFVATGAPDRVVELELVGEPAHCRGRRTTTVSTLDAGSTTLTEPRDVRFGTHESVTVPMASQSVAMVQISC